MGRDSDLTDSERLGCAAETDVKSDLIDSLREGHIPLVELNVTSDLTDSVRAGPSSAGDCVSSAPDGGPSGTMVWLEWDVAGRGWL